MKKYLLIFSLLFIAMSCSDNTFEDFEPMDSSNEAMTRAVTDTLTAELVDYFSSWHYSDFYVDAPGNLYGVYSKAYLIYEGLSDDPESERSQNNNDSFEQTYSDVLDIGDKPTYGFCVDLNHNAYYITSNNLLVKEGRVGPCQDLTNKFPENTVFLGITTAQVNSNVFVTTAQGDGSGNFWKSYDTQTLYRISANGTVTKISEKIYAPLVPNAPLVESYYTSIRSFKMFTYTSVLSKAKGAIAYGMDADGNYFKVNTVNGEVNYYIPRQSLQFLTAGTEIANPIALSGRKILQIRPNLNKDLVLGVLPSAIPEDARVLNFFTNANATIFYIVILETKTGYDGTLFKAPSVYRLRLNN